MSQENIKLTHQQAIVKLWGDGISETISLPALVSHNQVVDTKATMAVNIIGITWTADANAAITISRAGETIMTLPGGQSGSSIDLTGQQLPPDFILNDQDILVESNGLAQVYLTLRKAAGFKSTVEYATYGSYDDESIVGPQDISGTPGPIEMPRRILPNVGSGEYNFTLNVDTSEAGSAYEDTSYYWDVAPPNMTPGLYRKAFVGNFAEMPSSIDVNFCRNSIGWYGEADTSVGFGQQDLENASNYTFEWTGWFRAPKTGTYNFWLQADDDAHMWMNYPALENQNADGNQIVSTSNSLTKTSNSLIMTEGMWYPVRIQYGEWGGAEMCQVYWSTTDTDGVAYAGNDDGASGYQVWYHNSVTKGI